MHELMLTNNQKLQILYNNFNTTILKAKEITPVLILTVDERMLTQCSNFV